MAVVSHDKTIAQYNGTTSPRVSSPPSNRRRRIGRRRHDHRCQWRRIHRFFAGIAVNNAGHRHPEGHRRRQGTVDKVVHAASYIYHVPIVGETAEKLAKVSPGRLQKTFFANSGAEGIETAMRWPRPTPAARVISLTQSFHGRTYGTLSITGNKARKTHGGPYMAGCPLGTRPVTSIAIRGAPMIPRSWPPVVPICRMGDHYQSSSDVAAYLSEAVWGEGGIIVPPDSYFRRVKQILDTNGILFICDEVQSGFGRCGQLLRDRAVRCRSRYPGGRQGTGRWLPPRRPISTPEIGDSL